MHLLQIYAKLQSSGLCYQYGIFGSKSQTPSCKTPLGLGVKKYGCFNRLVFARAVFSRSAVCAFETPVTNSVKWREFKTTDCKQMRDNSKESKFKLMQNYHFHGDFVLSF